MKEKFQKFMQGRYGADALSRCMLITALILIVLSAFFRSTAIGNLLDTLGMLTIIFTYYRMFSRNISRRYEENQKFLGMTEGLRCRFQKEKRRMEQRKTHHIYACPGCGQKIRIPRGSGKKVEIDCPKCHTKFIKKI